MVEYIYDSWGKVLSTTGTYAGTVGLDQPFRYRGYVYDAETGWYYLQSRYYDPATCRFISADVLLSTGQGVIGNNCFAYCLNNPVNTCDPTGCVCIINNLDILLHDDRSAGTQTVFYCIEGKEKEAVEAFLNGFTVYYRGALLLHGGWPLKDTCAFFVIWVVDNHIDETILRHEYGHLVQECMLGELKYLFFIALPSVYHYFEGKTEKDYYSQPWELIADIFGGVERECGYNDNAVFEAINYFTKAYELWMP